MFLYILLDNTMSNTCTLQYCFSKYNIFYRIFPTGIRKNWKRIKIQIALDFNFCHHVEPEFTATTRNFASSISGQKHTMNSRNLKKINIHHRNIP